MFLTGYHYTSGEFSSRVLENANAHSPYTLVLYNIA